MFKRVAPIISGADLAICHLETPLSADNSVLEYYPTFQVPYELADAIKKLLLDEDLRDRLGISGYNFVHEECNCESMAKNSVELYKEVLKNNHNK